MKKSNLLFILGCCAFWGIPFDAQAIDCKKSYSCEDLGYSESDVDNCARYIHCPFDKAYKACAEKINEYTLTQCPTGGTCDTKSKLTGCQTGYKVSDSGDSCEATCTGAEYPSIACKYTTCQLGSKTLYTDTNTCASGYVKYTEKVDIEGSSEGLNVEVYDPDCMCAKSACKLNIISLIPKGSYLILEDGGFVRTGCVLSHSERVEGGGSISINYTVGKDGNGCVICESVITKPSLPSRPSL